MATKFNDRAVTSGQPIGFKVGSQSALNTMITNHSGKDGIFYLTNDTHRLYVGTADGYVVPVNQGIEYTLAADLSKDVSTWTDADKDAMAGAFYYVSDSNKLLLFNGSAWIEINTDQWRDITSETFAVSASSDVATVTNTIAIQDQAGNSQGSKSDSFTITGSNGITVTGSGKNVTLAGDTYTLSTASATNGASVKLDSTNTSNDSSFDIVGGGTTTVSRGSDGKITISSTDDYVTSLAFANAANSGNGFVLTGTRNSNGQTTGGSFDPTISVLTNGDGTQSSTVHFQDGNAALQVYSKSYIDSLMSSLNAMTYRGTFGGNGNTSGVSNITTSGSGSSMTVTVTSVDGSNPVQIHIGDTFLYAPESASTTKSYGNITYSTGSLLIAKSKTGAENASGYIDPANVQFDVVNERFGNDTNYSFVTSGDTGIALKPSTDNTTVGSYEVVAAANGLVTVTASDNTVNNVANRTVTLDHASVTTTPTTPADVTQAYNTVYTIPVVTSVGTDGKGHLNAYTKTNYKIKDTHASVSSTLTSITTAATAPSGNNTKYVGTITSQIGLDHGDGSTNDKQSIVYNLISESLKIVDDDTVNSKQGLNIEMVWGSF